MTRSEKEQEKEGSYWAQEDMKRTPVKELLAGVENIKKANSTAYWANFHYYKAYEDALKAG